MLPCTSDLLALGLDLLFLRLHGTQLYTLFFKVFYVSIMRGKSIINFSTTDIFKYHGESVYFYTVYVLVDAYHTKRHKINKINYIIVFLIDIT